MKAVLIISHGSRYEKTKEEVISLVEKLRRKTGMTLIHYAFLELQEPDIPDGIDALINKGADDILILLNFLNAGKHVDVDIPLIVKNKQKEFPQVKIRISSPVGQHDGIIDLFTDMIKKTPKR